MKQELSKIKKEYEIKSTKMMKEYQGKVAGIKRKAQQKNEKKEVKKQKTNKKESHCLLKGRWDEESGGRGDSEWIGLDRSSRMLKWDQLDGQLQWWRDGWYDVLFFHFLKCFSLYFCVFYF